MAVSVTLPALGESVTEGTVTRWLKAEGERVEADEPLLEVSTDKVDTEIPSPASGVLASIKVAEDETVEVGSELAVIDDGSGAPAPAAPAPAAEPTPAPAAPAAPSTEAAAPAPAPTAEAAAGSSGASGTDVVLPALGESVTEGTVTRWLKAVGESVEADEPLLEVSTDKVDTEIPSPVSGTVLEILVQEDETAEVGARLAVVGAAGAAPAAAPAPAAPAPAPAAAAPAPAARHRHRPRPHRLPLRLRRRPPPPWPHPPRPHRSPQLRPRWHPPLRPRLRPPPWPRLPPPRAVPVTVPTSPRWSASSPPRAAWTSARCRAPASAAVSASRTSSRQPRPRRPRPPPRRPPGPPRRPPRCPRCAARRVKMTRMRKVIGDNMMKALHSQAQLTSVVEVDVTRIMRLRGLAKESFAAREGVKLSPMPFFVKAAAQALKAHPVVNARINEDEGTITYFDTENIGIAVDSEKGLMTPVIKSAGDLNIAGIAKKTAELAGNVRASRITPDDLAGATFTISNTGSRGALFDTVIVPPNQAAILGIGATVKRPVVVETAEGTVIGVRDMTYLALSYDHRLVDGADAARYLTAVKDILEAGEFEVELGL